MTRSRGHTKLGLPTILMILVLTIMFSHQVSLTRGVDPSQVSSTGEADKVVDLPGQPSDVNFSQYAGYVNVNASYGRALFYWFFESPTDAPSKPLVLWLNGGPGCSSIGYGALEELGPFRVNNDGSTLSLNPSSWNKEANIIFLESPVGVGFSYSNTTSDYSSFGDGETAIDAHAFLIGWFEKFPRYKNHDFFIVGESYAGHYVPQLAKLILDVNKSGQQPTINLKGIMIGNGLVDNGHDYKGIVDYAWNHGIISDTLYNTTIQACDFTTAQWSTECRLHFSQLFQQYDDINIYDVVVDVCNYNESSTSLHHLKNMMFLPLTSRMNNALRRKTTSIETSNARASGDDPCIDNYVHKYLNREDVQKSLHANTTIIKYEWNHCNNLVWIDSPTTVLPILTELMASLRVWMYSGDMDGRLPLSSTRYSIDSLNLKTLVDWHPWFHNSQVAGWSEIYTNLTFATVRGAGHMVPSTQPKRALALFSSFIKGEELHLNKYK